MKKNEFDLAILGGGLVGSSLACALKDTPFKIALIERKGLRNPPLSRGGEQANKNSQLLYREESPDLQSGVLQKKPMQFIDKDQSGARAMALSPPSVQCLKLLSIWEKVAQFAEPILEVHVSKKKHFGVTRIKAKDYQYPNLGFVINADILTNALITTFKTESNVTQFIPDEMIDFTLKEDCIELHLASNTSITAKLAIAADGGDSTLRKIEGIGQKVIHHHQVAMVANLEISQPHLGVAYERFTDEGSLALLPMIGNQMKCVWIIPNKNHTDVQLSDDEFLKKLQMNFGARLGNFISIGPRVSYPLSSRYAESLYSRRLVLVGNAANTLHPIAAQGFNLGLRDIASLAEQLVLANSKKIDIGSIDFLRNYSNARQKDHQTMQQFTQSLLESNILQWFGIMATEWLSPLKRSIAIRGLGEANFLPKLCRGIQLSTIKEGGSI